MKVNIKLKNINKKKLLSNKLYQNVTKIYGKRTKGVQSNSMHDTLTQNPPLTCQVRCLEFEYFMEQFNITCQSSAAIWSFVPSVKKKKNI